MTRAGCWAAEYGNQLNMSYDELGSTITQGKEMGTYMYIYSGGEPLVRKSDIIRLYEKHDDCMFLAFTNGTLIDEAFAGEMRRVKNFVPAISIEGDRESTDARRGAGTYDKVIRAMRVAVHHQPEHRGDWQRRKFRFFVCRSFHPNAAAAAASTAAREAAKFSPPCR